ncbi:DUF1453 domain-containing protein [Streptomyces sp. NPDC057682]|uniref:DUF1453 domain-containing protein n=1 Tax=unclassified Streptomyces TaxID=2593676 RepID=UPI003657C85A
MSGLVNAVVIVAVVAVVVVRQFSAQPLSGDRSRWVLPGVLLVMALREPALLDAHHEASAAVVLGAELVVGAVTGAGWAWTTRVWRAQDGTLWSRGTRATVYVWAGGLVLRAALYGLAAALGIDQGGPALMAALAVTLLVREGLLTRRAAPDEPYGVSAGGASLRQPVGKDRL